jgi:hypothetical protein
MAEPVEVAIDKALVDSAIAFAAAQSPALAISLPNIPFTPPEQGVEAKWLRLAFLPAPTAGLGINDSSSNQHYGILQIDSVCAAGAGEYAPGRIASAVIAWFKFGTEVTQDGFTAKIWKPPYRGPLIKDDVWFFVPVSIPYVCFAPNPA